MLTTQKITDFTADCVETVDAPGTPSPVVAAATAVKEALVSLAAAFSGREELIAEMALLRAEAASARAAADVAAQAADAASEALRNKIAEAEGA